jgi:hypothetical protein
LENSGLGHARVLPEHFPSGQPFWEMEAVHI